MEENDTIKIIRDIEKNKKKLTDVTMRYTIILSSIQFIVGVTVLAVLFTNSDSESNTFVLWFIAIISFTLITLSIILPLVYHFRKKYIFILELLLNMKKKVNKDRNDFRV